jgi:hypothetical protein
MFRSRKAAAHVTAGGDARANPVRERAKDLRFDSL